ncbi:MAG: hypothetical protein AB7K86_22415 [Rhodospirillales bacterium]
MAAAFAALPPPERDRAVRRSRDAAVGDAVAAGWRAVRRWLHRRRARRGLARSFRPG